MTRAATDKAMTAREQAPVGGLLQRLSAAVQRQWWVSPPTPAAQALRLAAGLYAQVAGLHRLLSRPQRTGLPVVVIGRASCRERV